MTLPARKARSIPLAGSAKPRLAPPTPVKSDVAGFRQTASDIGIELMPWQETAARFLTATGRDGMLLYREVCIVVARQNGKTTLMKPLIIRSLLAGERIMHIAQTRELPREMFGVVADSLADRPDLFPKRRGKVIWPRYGSGQEEIKLANGGVYRIAAASRGSARGYPTDKVIIDELREMETDEVISAAEPTLTMSQDPQMIYLSNMGTDRSVVLNAIRERAGKDESLAYLEWSASPERAPDDPAGWAEANPAMGHYPQVERAVTAAYRRHSSEGTMAIFETERLCRAVRTMLPRVASEVSWKRARADLELPRRTMMGINTDAVGRASAALAWQQSDGTYGLRVIADVTGSPFDVDTFGTDLRLLAKKNAMSQVGFDDWTDKELAKFFKTAKAIGGKDFAAACQNFRNRVDNGTVHWDTSDEIGDAIGNDLAFSASKPTGPGEWMAVKANADRPITALLAAIRALWLASGPLAAVPRVM